MRTTNNSQLNPRLESLEPRQLLAAMPQIVGDFDLSPPSLEQQTDNAWLGNELFFAADDGAGDVELWKTDGTPAGTIRVKDIRGGALSSHARDITAIDGRVLFTASSDEFGRELWATDGTEAGTVLVQDLAPGAANPQVHSLTPMGGKLLFQHGEEIWSTDGTEANTHMMLDTSTQFMKAIGDDLYYTTRAGNEAVLWKANDEYGEHLKVDGFKNRNVVDVHALGDSLYIVTELNVWPWDRTLWRSDGTETGATRTSMDAEHVASMGGHLYFTTDGALFRTNGAAAMPERVAFFQDPAELRVADGMLYLVDHSDQGRHLWRTDGSRDGMQRLHLPPLGANAWLMAANDDKALFWSTTGNSRGLWAESRDAGVLTQLNDVISGPSAGSETSSEDVVAVGDMTFFHAGSRLWQTDGTDSWLVAAAPELARNPRLTALNGKLYFLVERIYRNHSVLWRTDGTELGTVPVVSKDTSIRTLNSFTSTSDRLYWTAPNQNGGRNIWVSDGTESGTSIVSSITTHGRGNVILAEVDGVLYVADRSELWTVNPELGLAHIASFSDDIEEMVAVGNEVFVSFEPEGAERSQLWASDGTAEGTRLLTDAYISSAIAYQDRLFFIGYSEKAGSELWISDGTPEGTHIVKDIAVGSHHGCGGEHGLQAIAHEDGIYFVAEDEEGNSTLWTSGRTGEGTAPVAPITGRPLGTVDGHVYFPSSDETGTELWKSDGTVEGTVQVVDLNPGAGSSMPGGKYPGGQNVNASAANGYLYFTADDGFHGDELWRIPLGTEQPADLAGDYNGDGRVGQADLDLVLLHWGQSVADVSDRWINDPPGSTIDQGELDAILVNWGTTMLGVTGTSGVTGAEQPPSVPDPFVGVDDGLLAYGDPIAAQAPLADALGSLLSSSQPPTMR